MNSNPNLEASVSSATSTKMQFKSTGKTLAQIEIARNGILETLKKSATISIETGINNAKSVNTTNIVENPFPIVVLVSGAGGNGKDTFIEAVGKNCSAYNLSSITEIKEIAEILVEYTKDIEDEMPVCPGKHLKEKSDQYRQFLHELKMAWANFCDGPNYRLIAELKEVLTEQITDGERYDVVFLHVREGAEIDKIKSIIENQFGIICLTMIVNGLVDPSDYVNDCDSNVNNYNYDLIIVNTPNMLTMFELQAMLFANNITFANRIFGFESNSPMYKIYDLTKTHVQTQSQDTETAISSTHSSYDPNVITTACNAEESDQVTTAETSNNTTDKIGFHSNLDAVDSPEA